LLSTDLKLVYLTWFIIVTVAIWPDLCCYCLWWRRNAFIITVISWLLSGNQL